jgi:hypothetical protein
MPDELIRHLGFVLGRVFPDEPVDPKAIGEQLLTERVELGDRVGITAEAWFLVAHLLRNIDPEWATGTPRPRESHVKAFPSIMLLTLGPAALLDALAASVASVARGEEQPQNMLSNVGGHVSRAIRRALLLKILQDVGWNAAHAAQVLGLGSSAHTLRAVAELGLEAEWQAAKDAGLVKSGGRHARAPDPLTTIPVIPVRPGGPKGGG